MVQWKRVVLIRLDALAKALSVIATGTGDLRAHHSK